MAQSGPADDDRTELVGPARGGGGGPAGPSASAGDPDRTLATRPEHGAPTHPEGSSAGDPEPASRGQHFGPYRLVRELGSGGQGVVYLADDLRLGRPVALKVLRNRLADDAWSRMRFEREAAAAARLDHRGICTVYETGEVHGTPYIAMRFVEGESLAQRLRERPRASRSGARRAELLAEAGVVERLARSLHAAHAAGLVHRDIKPGNVMIEPGGEPVILDFGLARDVHAADASLTGTGTFVGTPAYMSPEQTQAAAPVDHRTDIWSLGVTLYEIATGRRPFEAPTMEGLLHAIRTEEPLDPRRLEPAITPELAAVILTAIDKDPARRYQDAGAFADDLARARRLEPVRARPASAAVKLRRWAQRNPAVAASAAVVFVALAGGLGASLHFLGRANRAVERETRASAEAGEQRGRAEDLLGFMLGEMKTGLESVGRLELLAAPARKAAEYFASRPLDLGKRGEALQRAVALRNLGDVVLAEGDEDAAAARYEEALAIASALWDADRSDTGALTEYARTVNSLTAVWMARNESGRAVESAKRSLELRSRLLERLPGDMDARILHASGLGMLGNAQRNARQVDDARATFAASAGAWRALIAEDPRPASRRELAVVLQNLGEALRLAGDLDGAIAARREGLALFEQLAAEQPANREWPEQMATTNHGIALAHFSRKALAEALEHERRAVPLFRRLRDEDPRNTRRLYQLGHALNVLGVLARDSQDPDAAFAAFDEAVTVRTALAAIDVRNAVWRNDAAVAHRSRARALVALERMEDAEKSFDAAASIFRAIQAEKPRDAAAASDLADILDDLVEARMRLGRTLRGPGLVDAAGVLLEAVRAMAGAMGDAGEEKRAELATDSGRLLDVAVGMLRREDARLAKACEAGPETPDRAAQESARADLASRLEAIRAADPAYGPLRGLPAFTKLFPRDPP